MQVFFTDFSKKDRIIVKKRKRRPSFVQSDISI